MPYSIPPSRPSLRDPLISQRNPFEVFLLVVALAMGALSLFGHTVSGSVDGQSSVFVIVWAICLVVGAGVALCGVAMPLPKVDIGLHLERFGLIVMTGAVFVYAYVATDALGWGAAWPVSQNIAFGLACVVRVAQITRRMHWAATVGPGFEARLFAGRLVDLNDPGTDPPPAKEG